MVSRESSDRYQRPIQTWWYLMIYDDLWYSKQIKTTYLRCPAPHRAPQVPIFSLLRQLPGVKVKRFVGVLNSTTNLVLTRSFTFQYVSTLSKILHFSTTILGWLGTRKETKRQRLGFSSWQWKLATWCWEAFLISYFMDDSVERVGASRQGFQPWNRTVAGWEEKTAHCGML